METKERDINPEKSLLLIESMIKTAKQSYAETSIFFLIWGWLLLIIGIGDYFLIEHVPVKLRWVPWIAVIFIGVIASLIAGFRIDRKSKTKTIIDQAINYIWLGFGACMFLFLVLMFMNKGGGLSINIVAGLATFATGGVLKFKPLIIGGVLFWLFSSIAIINPENWVIWFCCSILGGYIIPGHLLRKREMQSNK